MDIVLDTSQGSSLGTIKPKRDVKTSLTPFADNYQIKENQSISKR